MTKKRLNGQFFTKNSDYILKGFSKYVKDKEVVDPFAGNQDLIRWAVRNSAKTVKGFDIDLDCVDNENVFESDSINNPQEYKFVLTNPPYLHKNKATKEVKEKYFKGDNSRFEDLYQLSIKSVLNSKDGILIVPLNFLSAENSKKIRHLFFNKFKIVALNIFKERVFEDTTYNVISFYYRKKDSYFNKDAIKAKIFPGGEKIKLYLDREYDWQLGGEFPSSINSTKNFLDVYRLTEKDLLPGEKKVKMAFNNIKNIKFYNVGRSTEKIIKENIIFLRAIDSKNGEKIQLEDIRKYGVCGLVGKNTSRNMAQIMFKKTVSLDEQRKLIYYFNEELNKARNDYFSLFLTNFRDNGRKRISFDFVYKLINYVYFNKLNKSFNKQIILNV